MRGRESLAIDLARVNAAAELLLTSPRYEITTRLPAFDSPSRRDVSDLRPLLRISLDHCRA
jgi:hypothetical protein